MADVMAHLQELHQKIELGGSAKARDKHIARGKILPREYVDMVFSDSADTVDV